MKKMWAGRTEGNVESAADAFNSSIAFDQKMAQQDIRGSMAHAMMLGATGILSPEEADTLIRGLEGILNDLESGALSIDENAEDIHMFVEQTLTERLGDVGKKLHTARSRNDQVALDLRLYLRDGVDRLSSLLRELIGTLCDKAEESKGTILPGYTHLQRAQPVTFGHHLMAYAMMFLRDLRRLKNVREEINVCPIGSCALAGTTYPIDRKAEAESLGIPEICLNSMDGVSDRDFALEFLFDASAIMTHLSRFCEEIVLWCSWEFRFVELSDVYTTGSSIMPQKKNPDMAELIRGKTGRVYGDLMTLLTVLKGLPLAYNKDLQEDKEAVFDALSTLESCLPVFTGMIRTMKPLPDSMKKAAQGGFINATDLADYLVRKGLPFRSAYRVSGQIVAYCIGNGKVLETLSLEQYRLFSPLIGEDVYDAIALENCVERRNSFGGTSVSSVEDQIAAVRGILSE